MVRAFFGIVFAIVLMTAGLVAHPAQSQSVQVAQAGSCASFSSTCASRCRKDNPADKKCFSDHCAPKLATCKATGCWREGNRYGGGQTCNLRRG